MTRIESFTNFKFLIIVAILCSSFFAACKPRQNEGQIDTIEVNLKSNTQDSKVQVSSTFSPGTVLILSVPENTSNVSKSDYLGIHYGKGLMDLANSTVSISLPLGTPIKFVQVSFSGSFTLEEIMENEPVANLVGLSDTVIVDMDTNSISVLISLFAGHFGTAVFDVDVMGN